MNKYFWHKLRRNQGFTLTELLMVVGILAILSAVSFPAVIHMRNSLRQSELDEKARQIFITAQNCLSGLNLNGIVLEVPPDGNDGSEMPEDWIPSDYSPSYGLKPDTYALCDGEAGSFSWMNDTAFSPALVREDKGSYVIEFNRRANVVYGVYYWEREGAAFQKESLFYYHENFNEYDGKRLRGPENKKNRMVPSVGYYGGEAAAAIEEQKEVEFQVSVYNEERLEASISMPSSIYQSAIFDVAISSKTDSSNGNRYSFRLQNGGITAVEPEDTFHNSDMIWKALPASGGEMSASYVLTLDSLEEGLHFADHFSGIAAGDDLHITVTGYCLGSDAVYIPKTKAVEINSLFAGLRGSDGKGDEVWVENGRHLQNLSYEVSGFGYGTDGADEWKSEYPVVCAKVMEDIDWLEPVYNGRSYDEVCTARRDFGATGQIHFYPISNHKTDLQAFMGNNHQIKGIHVAQGASVSYPMGSASGYAGMFGFMEGRPSGDGRDVRKYNVIQDVMLLNPHVEAVIPAGSVWNSSYAGSLAGYLDQMEIFNCGAFVDGEADEDLSDLYERTGVVTDFDYAGGLIGKSRDLTAGNSFASVKVAAGQTAGGFIGALSGRSEILTCYSGGHTVSGAYMADRPNVKASGAAGGFAGELGGSGRVEKTFSACSVSSPQCGPFAGKWVSGEHDLRLEATYGAGTAFASGGNEPDITGCGSVEEALAQGARKAERINTSPYDEIYRKDENAAFLYPIWLDTYRGDWAGSSFTGLIYYEKYQAREEGGEEFGFWYPDAEGNGSLRDDLPVISDGYGYLSDTIRTVKVYPNGKIQDSGGGAESGPPDWNGSEIRLIGENVQVEGKNQYLYALPWIHISHRSYQDFNQPGGRKDSFYDTLALTVDGAAFTAYYNPHFAKTIVFTEEQTKENPGAAIVRTARHLYELGYEAGRGDKNNTGYWKQGWDYVQERDVDYETYRAGETYPDAEHVPENLNQGMIGRSKTQVFSQSYDGGGHKISNLVLTDDSVGAVNGMALFGFTDDNTSLKDMVLDRMQVRTRNQFTVAGLVYTNCGSIKDVVLISPDIDASGSYLSRAAGLVYENIRSASIENCYVIPKQPDVAGEYEDGDPRQFRHIYGDDGKAVANNYTNARILASGNAAGFVGENYGTIKNCAAVAAVTATDSEYGVAAGFVCTNGSGSSGLIENSYSNCYTAAAKAAGFVYMTRELSKINGCYALRRVTSTSADGIAAGFSVDDAAGTISNCYAAVSCGYCGSYQVQPNGNILYPDCQYAGTQGHSAEFYPFSEKPQTNCYYMDWTENYSEEGAEKRGNAKPLSYAELKKQAIHGLVSADQNGGDTVTFSRMLPGVYPFPKADGLVQYGDWPNYEYVGAELTYFEIYKEDGNYAVGFYNKELGLESLQDDKHIFMDGYGLLFNTEYLEMDGVNVKNLIQGNSSSNEKAYLSWEDWNGNDNTTEYTTNYLKSVYNLRDNSGKKIERGVSYYQDMGGKKTAVGVGSGSGYPDQPISLSVNNRPGTYYFRILPPAAVVTNAYVPSDSVYQRISIHVESNYYDEMGGVSSGIIKKDREFYYCPHFAKSRISTDERPEDPEQLYIRTTRQLCTLSSDNQVQNSSGEGLQNYYEKSFVQELDIDLGSENDYAFYYSDTAPLNEERGRSGYRWFNSSIGSEKTQFGGVYDGGSHAITGLGAWKSRSGVLETGTFNKVDANRDVPLFGHLNGAQVKDLTIRGASMVRKNEDYRGVFCRTASGKTEIDHVTLDEARLEIHDLTAGAEAFGLLAGTLSGSSIKDCIVNNSVIECQTTQVKYIGGAVGRLTGGGTIDGLHMDDVSVKGSRATHLGGTVGYMDSGNVQGVSVTGKGAGTAVMEGDRAVGGLIGQINSGNGAVSVGNISMTGTITVRQTSASHNTKLYDGAGLAAGLCEIGNYPVSISDLWVQGTEGSILVENAGTSQYHIGGFVLGSLYKSSGDGVLCSISFGNMGIHGASLVTADPGRNNTYCAYGGLIGQNSKAAVLAEGTSWDFSGSSISAAAESGKNGYHTDSGIAGLAGKFLEKGSMTLPKEVILPDISVHVQPGGSIPVAGVVNAAANRVLTIQAADHEYSSVKVSSIITENCQNTGGLTPVLTDYTVFSGIRVESAPSDGLVKRPGYIQAAGNAGGIAGTISAGPSNKIKQLSVNGLQITGAGNVGGFAGTIKSGSIEQCYAYADVTALWPADSAAGGFVGKMENGTIDRCYASGNVAAYGEGGALNVLKAGGFFGDVTASGRIENCYASGDVSLRRANAASGSALGGFGGSISSQKSSQVSVARCYSVGAVAADTDPAGMDEIQTAEAGGFIGHLSMSRDTFAVTDDMIQNLIRIMKDANVHNRRTDQNGKAVWNLDIGMDSETRGIFDNSNISALVYNILGYPEYPRWLESGRENTNEKAPVEEIRSAYEMTFDSSDRLIPPSADSDISYYHTFFKKSQENALMTMWAVNKAGGGKYLYWINEKSPAEGMVYTGYRINLDEYDRALTQEPENMGRRRDLFETKQIKAGRWASGSYDGKPYFYLTDLGGTWQPLERAAVSDCFFLREDGSALPSHNAEYGPVESAVEPWTTAQFGQEMTREMSDKQNAVLTAMRPALENAGPGYEGYPFPMLEAVGAGGDGWNHTGLWPFGYQPYYEKTP
ncbi:prepilin-type N-terminal cleavage/methylation domain-containing protein [Clostridium sp. MCC353]|uniref:type II secretion system protein n=1 Tax=Clostridium sp. MCC353 TaxID=2592646 RepID=UPI001C02B61D|nr:type II secretion system protein [Clostridium sp. MCC353]MBT9779181.1 prepilin-type N-terminal cleavage/methylation domain-containing protein [Clostridium sp. MCC353]